MKCSRLFSLGAAGVLILVVVILSLLSAFGRKSDGQSTGNGTSSAVTEDGKLVIQDLYEGEITIPKFNVPLNTYDQSKFKNDNGLVTYDDANKPRHRRFRLQGEPRLGGRQRRAAIDFAMTAQATAVQRAAS